MMMLTGIIFGSTLFWVLIASAVAVIGGFIAAVLRGRALDRAVEKPVSEKQVGMLYTSTQLEELKDLLADTGYAYDWQQDVFYSVLNPWQRKMGYCSLYDVASAGMGMVIDCEPFYFDYGGKKWMIELWKGQYGITAGGEIGIYNTTGPELNIPGVFNGTFYFCAKDNETLSMTYALLKRNRLMFSRAARHWWLTGFRLGEYARPSALVMEASITFKDPAMKEAFLGAVRKAGYRDNEIRQSGNTVLLIFSKPHTKQPMTRHGLVSFIAMRINKKNVNRYRKLTKGLSNLVDIIATLRGSSPKLYDLVMNMGRRREVYSQHDVIKPYLNKPNPYNDEDE
jgi:hypothetical protein